MLPDYGVQLIVAIQVDFNMSWGWWLLDVHILEMVDIGQGEVVRSDFLILKEYFVLNFIILRQELFRFLPHRLTNNTNTHR